MTNILVTWATKAGSTTGIAETIAATLREQGAQVDLMPVNDVTDVTRYDALVIGSAIRASSWLPEAVTLIETHQAVLAQKPVAYFTACLTLAEDTPENREEVHAYTDPVREILAPQAEAFFAGAMDLKKLSFPVRLLIKSMKAPQGDFRDMDAVTAWAQSIYPILTGSAQPTLA